LFIDGCVSSRGMCIVTPPDSFRSIVCENRVKIALVCVCTRKANSQLCATFNFSTFLVLASVSLNIHLEGISRAREGTPRRVPKIKGRALSWRGHDTQIWERSIRGGQKPQMKSGFLIVGTLPLLCCPAVVPVTREGQKQEWLSLRLLFSNITLWNRQDK
jgi:hypothetical protein